MSPFLDDFRRALAARLGLRFDEDKAELLSRVLEERAEARGARSPDAYLALLARGDAEETAALAERLTVGETYFFRNAQDMEAFAGEVLPQRVRARASERRLRILSAGCSTGEEPYTLAMLARSTSQLAAWDVRVHGFDLNPAAVERARTGRYSGWSLRQTSPELRARFFVPEGREVRVADDVRALVTLEQRNLVDDDPVLWAPATYDVVFCRNVLMYLAPEVARRVVARIARALAPGGFLFLGHAETLRGLSTEFHLRHTHGTFYYQSRVDGEPVSAPWPEAHSHSSPRASSSPEGPAPQPATTGWFDVIRDSSQRIAELTGSGARAADPPGEPLAPRAGAAARAGRPRRRARAPPPRALRRGARRAGSRPGAGRGRGPAPPPRDPARHARRARGGGGGLLARARARRAERGGALRPRALPRGRGGCRQRRPITTVTRSTSTGRSRCRASTSGCSRGAQGISSRRGGSSPARSSCFAAEDPSRILLLGGGFTRDALVALCRAELVACGGHP